MMDSERLKKKLGERLKENVVIRDYVATSVGGVVDLLTVCDSIGSLIETINLARYLRIPYRVIGQGSNVLFSDVGFAGLVIINRTSNISFIIDKSQVIVDSGVLLSRLIMEVASRDLTGLEFLFGLRGTVGGAVVNNRQANGVTIGSTVKGLTLLMPDGKLAHEKAAWMDFEAHSSRLLRARSSSPEIQLPAILTVTLQLSRNKKEEILRKIQHFGAINREMWPLEEPSIGPIFCDPSPKETALEKLKLLDLRKVKRGRARIFPRQPNFILTNERGLGPGKTADIYELIKAMKGKARQQTNVLLEEAIEYIGDWPKDQESLIEYE